MMSDLDSSAQTLEGRADVGADTDAARLSLKLLVILRKAERSRSQHWLARVSGGYLGGGVGEPVVYKA